MNLIILKDNLREGLNTLERAVSENNALPILKNILLQTEAGKVRLSATNLEIGVTNLLFGKISEEGSVTVPFQALYNIINNSDTERITLLSQDTTLIIKGENYEAKIQGLNPDDFPIIPKIDNQNNSIEIDSSTFKSGLSDVSVAAHVSEIRPEISGVLFDFQIGIIKLVATDSFRLAEKTIDHTKFKTNFTQGFKTIIPLKTIQEIMRIFSDNKPIKIYFDNHQILIKNENVELISRIIEGNYPDYEQIIPKSIETEITVKRDNLVNALKLVSTFSSKTNDIRLKITENNKAMELYSANQNLGENNYLIPIKSKGADNKSLSFNWRYLLDGLKAIKTEDIFFGINSNNRPALLKSPDSRDYFYILMPIKGD